MNRFEPMSNDEMVNIFKPKYENNFQNAIQVIQKSLIENFKHSVTTVTFDSDSKPLVERLEKHFMKLGYSTWVSDKKYDDSLELNYRLNVSLSIKYNKEGNVE